MKMWNQSMKRISKIFLLVLLFYIILYVAYILGLPFLLNWLEINIEDQKSIIIFCSKFGNSFLIPLMMSFLLFYFGIIEKERLQYLAGLNELISEMNYNFSKILEFPKNVEERYNKCKNGGEWEWLPKKVSYTNWADGQNFSYKYFPTNAYFNFINNGYILNKKYWAIPAGNIALFYRLCIEFNINTQKIENLHCRSIDFLCTFIKSEDYQDLLYGNYLNKGLIGEYRMILENLKEYNDIDKDLIEEYNKNMKNYEDIYKETMNIVHLNQLCRDIR